MIEPSAPPPAGFAWSLSNSEWAMASFDNIGECMSVETGISLTEAETEVLVNIFATLISNLHLLAE